MKLGEFLEAQKHKSLVHALDPIPNKTNTTAVIVAVPSPLADIRLVGDEEKHATLLFFGETSSLPADAKDTLLNTLGQAVKVMPCFAEDVVGISRLGSDTPPALVAMLSNRCLGQYRSILQISTKLHSYLSNTPQYPNYTPHVTLGYPDYQGESELREMAAPISRVKFDRLALWWNDERFDFPLYDYSTEDSNNSAMMAEKFDEFLAHHGVKGMKWGIRRERDSSGGDTSAGTTTAIKPMTAKDMSKARPGTIVTRTHTATGETKVLIKKKDGTWVETHLSADAERTVKTSQKLPHEASDREIKEAVARARLIEDYNKFFGNDPNKELKQQVDQLELQKKYSEIHSVLHPSRKAKVAALVASAGTAYGAYAKLNKASNGALGRQIRGAFVKSGMVKTAGKHTVGVALKKTTKAAAKTAVKEVI